MTLRRASIKAWVCAGLMLALASEARAQFGGLQRTLFRGLEFAGNPLFLSAPQNGPLFNFNRFSRRVEFNRLAGGYTYESFRLFGPDTFDNPNSLDLGPLKIQLGPDPALVPSLSQPVGFHNRVGYTTRFIPEVFFETQSGQRAFNQFTGVGTFSPTPVRYTITFNAGVQDFQWSGNFFVDAEGRMNALGFYDFQMQLTNVGNYEANGFIANDEQVTDFDTGPINVSGNILMDALAGLAQANGTITDAIGPRVVSGAAQKNKVDDLMGRLEAGETLSDSDVQFLVEQMFTNAFLADPLGVLTNGFPSEVPGFEALSLALSEAPDGEGTGDAPQAVAIPEPATLGFLVLVLAILAVIRPLGRRWV